MPKMENFDKVISVLRAKAAKAVTDTNVSVAVGYTQKYALYVHENLEMKLKGTPRSTTKAGTSQGDYWDPPGSQSKFLETPFRQNSTTYAGIVRRALGSGLTMGQALVMAGLQLQADSQRLVPIHYGFLRASAFTRLEVPARSGGGQHAAT